jgi:cytochrome P450
LSQNPEVKAKLYKELDEVLGDSEPTMENLPELVYTRRLLMESMRLYPPVVFFDRQPAEDWDTGSFIVPRKTFTFLCPYTMHRHPDYFPDPMKFDPDRWTSEFTASLPKGAYFPFGGGPRICIGEHFSWAELTLAVVTIAQRWDMELSPGQTIGISPTLTLRPKTGIKMKLKARERKTTAV